VLDSVGVGCEKLEVVYQLVHFSSLPLPCSHISITALCPLNE
jgi:hypothetical protein